MGIDIPSDPAPDGYVPNPYQVKIDAALTYLRAEKEGNDGWENIDTVDGIILEKKYENDGSAIPVVRGHGLVKGLSAPSLLSAILQPSARHLWDARFESGALLERYGRKTYKFYSVQKGVGWVVSERDIVGVQHVQEGENGAFELVQTSVDGPPGDKGRVRASLTAGWSVSPRGDDLEVAYVVKINPNGSIPSAIVGKIVQDIPLSVVNITNFIRDKGVPPYITNKELSSQLRTDIVNIEEKKHVANLIAGDKDEEVTFAVDPKVFGGSWKVDVSAGVSADKSGNNAVVKVPAGAGRYQVTISAA